jgi:membrane protein implicated in regulation of membrane protease activity
MFFVIIFLILAALASYLFPTSSWAAILVFSLGGVAALRLILHLLDRADKTSEKNH